MADYAIANQIRPFQLPDIAGIANAMSSQSLNAMREDQLLQQSQQLRGAEAERGALRELFSRPGFDPMAPGSAREILQVAPTTGPATFNALMRARADQRAGDASARAGAASDRAAAVAGVEMAVKNTALFRDMFATATPENYAAIRAAAVRAVPQWDTALPTGYTPDGVQRILMTADRALARHFVNQTGDDGMQRVLSMPRYGEGPAAIVPGSESAARPQRMMGPSGPMEISGGPGGSSYTMIPPAGAPAAPGAPLAVPEPMAPVPAPMVPGPRTGAAPATPINAMLAPPDATVVGQPLAVPDFARRAAPRTIADADIIRRELDVQQAEAIARGAANVRGDKPPPPTGQRYNAQGVLENIPGSPQERATTERRGAQLASANVVTRDIDRILERLDNAVMPVTGFTAPTMAALASGSPAADVAELRKTIEGNISFNKLNDLRQQSPTGGALGNVTDKDLELLKTTLGSLNQNQSPRQFRQNLLNVRDAFMEVIHGPNFRDAAPPAREPPAPERLPGRRNAPPTGNRPTLDQFLERARPANPNASLEDLTAYYNREYGGR